jgi:hypothetical protein
MSRYGNCYIISLFTEKRKLVQDDSGDKLSVRDTIEIDLRTLGSFAGNIRAGDRVMEMAGSASSGFDTVSFSNGFIVVESPWQGLRIGTYMMNRLVAWAVKHYATYQPIRIKLLALQADGDNKERRNRFYARFGFKFVWADDEQLAGELEDQLRIGDLATTDLWQEKIEELSLVDGLKEIFCESQRHQFAKVDAERCKLIAVNDRCHAESKARLSEARMAYRGIAGFALGMVLAAGLFFWLATH